MNTDLCYFVLVFSEFFLRFFICVFHKITPRKIYFRKDNLLFLSFNYKNLKITKFLTEYVSILLNFSDTMDVWKVSIGNLLSPPCSLSTFVSLLPEPLLHCQYTSCFDCTLDFWLVGQKAAFKNQSLYSFRRGCGYTMSFWEIPQYRSNLPNTK